MKCPKFSAKMILRILFPLTIAAGTYQTAPNPTAIATTCHGHR